MYLDTSTMRVSLEGEKDLHIVEAGLIEAYMIRFNDLPSEQGTLPKHAVERLLGDYSDDTVSVIVYCLQADGFLH